MESARENGLRWAPLACNVLDWVGDNGDAKYAPGFQSHRLPTENSESGPEVDLQDPARAACAGRYCTILMIAKGFSFMNTIDQVRGVLSDVLQLGTRRDELQPATALLGSIPELDSMAVVGVIAALEEHFGISFSDDEISADAFATLGSLAAFVEEKCGA